MKKIIRAAILCATMATAVSTFGGQPVSATYPLIDKNGNTVPVERDVDNQKTIDDNQKLIDRYRWYDQVDDYDLVETNIESAVQEFGYPIQVPSYMPIAFCKASFNSSCVCTTTPSTPASLIPV